MADYTTTELIAKVKLYGSVPSSQPIFTAANLLRILTDELQTNLAPFLLNFLEEYYVTSTDHDITTSTTSFNLPSRTVAGKLREVNLIDSDGDKVDVPRINPQYSEKHSFGFYFEDNKIVLLEYDDYTNYDLRLYYYTRPSKLVETSDCAKITSVGTTTVDVSSVPTAWTSPKTVDLVQNKPPFNLLSTDVTATWTGTTITLSTVPDDLAVDDYICAAEESCVPMIPYEMHPMLIWAAVMKVHNILMNTKGFQLAMAMFNKERESVRSVLSPRVDGERRKIVSYEGFLS